MHRCSSFIWCWVEEIANSVSINGSYVAVAVTGGNYSTGGMAEYLGNSSSINGSYAGGAVSGTGTAGGLVGSNWGIPCVSASFWNSTVNSTLVGVGSGDDTGVTGKTASELKNLATFGGWDIADYGGSGKIWRIYEGQTHPLLRYFLGPLTISANDAAAQSVTPYSGGNGVSYNSSGYSAGLVTGTLTYGGDSQGASAPGSYSIIPGGLYSSQTGYDISFVNGTLTLYTILSVTYDGNGATGGSVPIDTGSPYAAGATVAVKSNSGVLTRDGYVFAEWNTAANGSGAFLKGGAAFRVTANTTFYAQWITPQSAFSDRAASLGFAGENAFAFAIATDASGNSYVAGYFESSSLKLSSSITLTSSSYTNGFVAKMDAAGTVLWSKKLSDNDGIDLRSIAVDGSGNIYVAGNISEHSSNLAITKIGNQDAFTFKLDNNGAILWAKNFGGADAEAYGLGIAADDAGNFYLGGYSYNYDAPVKTRPTSPTPT